MLQPEIYFGTSGLILPVPNKQFYPEAYKTRSRLSYYSSLMNSIEINSSFYKIPQAKTIRRWTDEVPDHFKFTFKLWSEITHVRGLAFQIDEVHRFMEVIAEAGPKKGALLLQFPPSITFQNRIAVEKLLSIIRSIDSEYTWDIALEFRHPTWYCEQTVEMLGHYEMGIVLHDKKPAVTPLDFHHCKFVYLRFHGPDGNYKGSYDPAVLSEYAAYIHEWEAENKQIYVYFNNTMGNALQNLDELRNLVLQGNKL